jgi:predicted nucleic acid-binding protein
MSSFWYGLCHRFVCRIRRTPPTRGRTSRTIISQPTPLVTTRAVLLEIGNALSKKRYRQAAGELLDALERDPQVEIVLITEELYQQALALFCSRLDKEWGLIDCVSFIVMQERGLTDALTTDEHFEQAGFRALLRFE